MKPEQLGNIAKLLGGHLEPAEAERVYVRGVCTDTRKIAPGDIFFALEGERDGHDFVMDAYTKGAIAVIVRRQLDIPLPQIVVDNTLEALGELAKAYREAINPRVVAITGSIGKTTAREMIAAVLRTKFNVHSAKFNYNNLIGLPLTLLEMETDTEIAVVELGINRVGEMKQLLEIAQPDVGVITSIAPVHIEGLESIEGILREKSKLAYELPADAPLFINIDSPELAQLANEFKNKVTTYGTDRNADFHCEKVSFINGAPTFVVGDARFKMKLLGNAPIYAALAALAVGEKFGIPKTIAAEALKSFRPQPHRMQLIECGEMSILDDSYNSSPIALAEAFRTMELIDAERKIAVLGDMLELGKLEEKYHREIAELLMEYNPDCAILFGEAMQYAFEQAKELGFAGEIRWYRSDFQSASQEMLKLIKPGDLVLIKGSNSLKMVRFVNTIISQFCEEIAQ